MLVINFKTASLDLNLQLPVVGSARPVEGEEQLLILNINKEGELKIYGATEKKVEAYIAMEAQADLLAARVKNPKLQPREELPTMVVIRFQQTQPRHQGLPGQRLS
jgi:biopolymer transport protein ExbD